MREPVRRYRTESPAARKKSVNLSLDSELVRQAKAFGINISRFVEENLALEVKRLREEAWKRDNKEAIEAYNRHVERDGVFSDGLRRF